MKRDEFLRLIEENGGPDGLRLEGITLEPDLPNQNGMNLSPRELEALATGGKHLQRNDELPGAGLEGISLPNLRAKSLHAKKANLKSSDLPNADLEGADLEAADLSGARLPLAVLSHAVLRGAILEGVDLHGATLAPGHLDRATFVNTDLSQAIMDGSEMETATFSRVNLSEAKLVRAFLGGSTIEDSNLSRADLTSASMRRLHLRSSDLGEANLTGANLQGAIIEDCSLSKVDLTRYNLTDAHFSNSSLVNACLFGVVISPETDLSGVTWGNFVLGEEMQGRFGEAEVTYRWLKRWYQDRGDYKTASEFAYRENVAARKALPNSNRLARTSSWLLDIMFGYGERPLRLFPTWLASIAFFAVLIWLLGTTMPDDPMTALYFSAVSFAPLGYGSWIKDADWVARALGVIETFVGVFLLALFVTTFVRRFTR